MSKAILFCLLGLSAGPALAESIPLTQLPTSYTIAPAVNPRNGQIGTREAPGSWRIAQWHNPHEIESVQTSCEGGYLSYSAESASLRTQASTVTPCPGAAPTAPPIPVVTIAQSGKSLPCTVGAPRGRTVPQEFDATVAANRASINPTVAALPLSSMTAIHQRVEFRSLAETVAPSGCRVNRAKAFLNVTLNNGAGEVLFYRVIIRSVGTRVPPVRVAWWAKGKSGVGTWVSEGSNRRFGIRDNVEAYGVAPVRAGVPVKLDLDLLPRLVALIREGARYGMDQDLSNWRIRGTHFGHNLWGGVDLTTEWRGYAVEIQRSASLR